jgi:hypothetical protein
MVWLARAKSGDGGNRTHATFPPWNEQRPADQTGRRESLVRCEGKEAGGA